VPAAPERPAFYALGGGRWRDLLTLLHPPYTAWHLSYFALGAAIAPHFYLDRLLWGLLAFLLAVGVSAHAFDELHGRPLKTGASDRTLMGLAALSLAAAIAIGVAAVLTISVWLAPLVLIGGLLVPAYNLELFGGRMHNDMWFAFAWGAFPAFTGYFVNALRISLAGILIALGCMLMSVAQRHLSTQARQLRRQTRSISGVRIRRDGGDEPLTLAYVLTPLERALGALSLALVLTASALVTSRL
jgi:hypothetical protein